MIITTLTGCRGSAGVSKSIMFEKTTFDCVNWISQRRMFSDLLAVQCPFDEIWFNIPSDETWWAIIYQDSDKRWRCVPSNYAKSTSWIGVRIGMVFGECLWGISLSRECPATFTLFSTHLTSQQAASSWWPMAPFSPFCALLTTKCPLAAQRPFDNSTSFWSPRAFLNTWSLSNHSVCSAPAAWMLTPAPSWLLS